ncbi:peptide ABC transporter substrate-binding protein [Leifsonia sp. 1010]|uniref:peptide ABC transporter substrate-binding protein n=1 Tax=Leifsonia sp. 1010 TaxID=2817769 RepID=UPI002858ECEC|nr:peptide ABC transporter substrate-binding protein [Leifsonia sp. 1010]MDR6613337.1 hypothetical protein [Leifsonia sp. 1010]
MTGGGGTLVSATGSAGQTLDMALSGPVWNFSSPVETVWIDVTVPDGTNPINQRIVTDGLRYTLYHLPTYPANVWRIAVDSPTGVPVSISSLSIPTFQIAEITPGALQGTVTYDIYQVGLDGVNELVTGEFQPSATFTWTEDQPDTPVIAPAIGGAAAIAGIGLAGIVLVRRRRNAEQA